MKYQPALLIAVTIAVATSVAAQDQATAGARSAATFAQLKSLAGEWEAVQDGVPVKETYTLTANGSTLMAETRPASEPAMITMFTVDGQH